MKSRCSTARRRRRIFRLKDRRNERVPGLARFRRVMARSGLGRRRRNHNEMIAGRALNLFSPQPVVTLQVLVAMRARELELAHDETVSGNWFSAIAELSPIVPCDSALRRKTELTKVGPRVENLGQPGVDRERVVRVRRRRRAIQPLGLCPSGTPHCSAGEKYKLDSDQHR